MSTALYLNDGVPFILEITCLIPTVDRTCSVSDPLFLFVLFHRNIIAMNAFLVYYIYKCINLQSEREIRKEERYE